MAKSFYELLDDPVAVLLRLRQRGDVVSLIDRNPAVVCVFGPERNREILTNPAVFRHDETMFRGPPGSAMEKMRWSSVTINGEVHRRHRKLMQPAFQKSALDDYAAEIVAMTRLMVGRWRVGGVASVDTLCRDAALAMAMKCLYGIDVSGDAHGLGHMAAEWVDAATTPAAFLLPFDLPGTPYRKMVTLGEEVVGRIRGLMEQKRRMGGDQKDALALLMNARDEDETSLSDDELVAEAASLFVAAHETTAMTLAWTLLLLDRHPEVQTALAAEIDAVLGGRDPGPEDIPKMFVLDRVLKESMRILCPVPMLFMRVCAEASTVGGFAVPKGCNVLLSPMDRHGAGAVWLLAFRGRAEDLCRHAVRRARPAADAAHDLAALPVLRPRGHAHRSAGPRQHPQDARRPADADRARVGARATARADRGRHSRAPGVLIKPSLRPGARRGPPERARSGIDTLRLRR